MKKNAKHADSLYILLKPKLFRLFGNKDDIVKQLKTFAECSVIGSILAYFVSTTILLLRNLVSGLPFVPLSIIQAVVVTVYFCIFVSAYAGVEYIVCSIWKRKREVSMFSQKVVCVICAILFCIVTIAIAAFILSWFFRSFMLALLLILVLFVILPMSARSCYRLYEKSQDYAWMLLFVIIFAAANMVWNLPASAGGLGSQKVAYRSSSGLCQEYDYYGVVDGMLVLQSDDKISLIPVGDGYIEYVVPKYSFLGPAKDEQKGCEADFDSSAPRE